jgi:D-sedoheptulose 7-phosphate isomerase
MSRSGDPTRFRAMFAEEIALRPGAQEWAPAIEEAFLALCDLLVATLAEGGTVYACGNGGSAAQAQHFTAEIVGRFRREHRPQAAVSLTVDTSALTSLANDYGYEEVFRRQAEGLMRPGDLLLGLSTSGTSPNVVRAVEWAREAGLATAALTGPNAGPLAAADVCVSTPGGRTDLVQEQHLVLIHLLAEAAERAAVESV